ncbi:UTP--glucose-1-phosphate uridylyltransferase GalU [Niveibacterium umoris]|uniref:UTP--glucose-1-phosphate uridylyltransferase n=1 Tax=Niveibacterium umoris TaxID=1193620 RepID=A0A840BDD5_9RHOO|nr:UTP--glucose-1-phosphate uridylyltransferase GalU [Niveibacterium umoris]MBB4011531.1 UTP--glucose-1-phosphate uridylyltransferase [Niveibacterium umoris]
MKRIRKAVFPVAGLGSRFLPATKVMPKEMLPIVDKPIIQYAVEEAADAGITDMVFIIGRTKRAIADHFDKAYELESELESRGKFDLLKIVQDTIPKGVNCIFIRQAEALGLGHAVLCAEPVVGSEPFAVLLADDLLDGPSSVTAQMSEVFNYHRCSVLGVMEVPRQATGAYGVVSTEKDSGDVRRISGIVEKPKPEEAPSNLAVVGRYVLTPQIFEHLRNLKPGTHGELQLTDAISALLREESVLAYRFNATRYDCGDKLGYLKATVELGMRHGEIGTDFSRYLEEKFGSAQP